MSGESGVSGEGGVSCVCLCVVNGRLTCVAHLHIYAFKVCQNRSSISEE